MFRVAHHCSPRRHVVNIFLLYYILYNYNYYINVLAVYSINKCIGKKFTTHVPTRYRFYSLHLLQCLVLQQAGQQAVLQQAGQQAVLYLDQLKRSLPHTVFRVPHR